MSLADRLIAHDTATLSDALDRLGIDGQCRGIHPVSLAGGKRIAGQAFTVRYLPVGVVGGSVGDYIDDVQPGQVVVIDNYGRLDATVWGDILTDAAHRKGVAGTVIDGVCRDANRSDEIGYSIFARERWMRTGKDRVTAVAFNESVQLGAVRVDPGDWIVGDLDGVLVIPASRVEDVLAAADEIGEAEERIRAQVAQGIPLVEARKQQGYHALQTRADR